MPPGKHEATPPVSVASTVKANEPAAAVPTWVEIPKLGLSSQILSMDLTKERIVDTPDYEVGWYKRGAKAGEAGTLVLQGHFIGLDGNRGIFYRLSELSLGDSIFITDEGGQQFRYVVAEKELIDTDSFPTQKVYGKSNLATLNLVTCAGNYDSVTKTYTQRTIVYTKLAD